MMVDICAPKIKLGADPALGSKSLSTIDPQIIGVWASEVLYKMSGVSIWQIKKKAPQHRPKLIN